ncbi:hypothetical protein K0B03_00030 [Patescibacteria group bacterium]|nr:hypothetical protein [Patescibacteria group bacterium]
MKKINIFQNSQKQKGQVAIFIVFFISSMLLFMTLFLVNMTMKQTRNSRKSLNSVQAFYYADMGAEKVLRGIKQGEYIIAEYDLDVNPEIILLTDSSDLFEVKKVAPSGLNYLEIKSTGYYEGTSRAVKLSW